MLNILALFTHVIKLLMARFCSIERKRVPQVKRIGHHVDKIEEFASFRNVTTKILKYIIRAPIEMPYNISQINISQLPFKYGMSRNRFHREAINFRV